MRTGADTPGTDPRSGDLELEDAGSVLGRNLCLSEFQAAILTDRLHHLDAENRQREDHAMWIESELERSSLARGMFRSPHATRQTYFRFCLRLNTTAFGSRSIETIADALSAELRLPVCRVEEPLNAHPLYRPLSSPIVQVSYAQKNRIDPSTYELPQSVKAWRECILLPHNALMGDSRDASDIVAAFCKGPASTTNYLAPRRTE